MSSRDSLDAGPLVHLPMAVQNAPPSRPGRRPGSCHCRRTSLGLETGGQGEKNWKTDPDFDYSDPALARRRQQRGRLIMTPSRPDAGSPRLEHRAGPGLRPARAPGAGPSGAGSSAWRPRWSTRWRRAWRPLRRAIRSDPEWRTRRRIPIVARSRSSRSACGSSPCTSRSPRTCGEWPRS